MNIKNKIFGRSVIIGLIAIIFLINSGVSYAELSESQITAMVKDIKIKDCDPANLEKAADVEAAEGANTLDTIYLKETKKFIDFVQQTTSNPSDTSSLSNTIIARYREYKHDMDNILTALLKKNYKENLYSNVDFGSSTVGWYDNAEFTYGSLKSYNDAFSSAEKCSQLKAKYIQTAKDIFMNKLTDSSIRKKSVILMEKLQAINNRLREMNSKITTFYGLFKTFSNKIICFEKNKCMAL